MMETPEGSSSCIMWKTRHLLRATRSFPRCDNCVSRALSTTLNGRPRIRIHPEVRQALDLGEPVVALESTIVAHGMPYPQNLQVAQDVESILRQKGVTPATIAVKDGVCQVGLTPEDLRDLAKAGTEGRATKCSTRELSLVLAAASSSSQQERHHQWGATTVASTMVLAHRAGISTFVTGGIGGVHRNGQDTMDVSADLTELSRTPVVVISAGIKSILDIARTLEVLETLGVPTVSFATDEFPAFFSPRSGVQSPARIDAAEQVAEAYWAARDLHLSHGMLVAVPNQDTAGENVERAIQHALGDADAQGIHGQALTPFILKQVARETKGDSLQSNMALVRHNASVGADIAVAISKRTNKIQLSSPQHIASSSPVATFRSKVVVLGGTVMDIVAKPDDGRELLMGTSNPGFIMETDGGVGRNIAEALGRLGSNPLFYSAVGNDSRGLTLVGRLQDECGVTQNIKVVDEADTATYLAVLNGWGDMHTAVADMAVLRELEPPPVEAFHGAEMFVMDGNPPISVMKEAAMFAVANDVKVAFEPTSVPKARAVTKEADLLSYLTYVFPNVDELVAIADVLPDNIYNIDSAGGDILSHVRTACLKVLSLMQPEAHVIVTMGDRGVLLATKEPDRKPHFHEFPSQEDVKVMNATGAGDSLCGAFIHSLLEGRSMHDSILFGMECARLSILCSEQAISPELSQLGKKSAK